jgi:Pyrimidine dimer DNA glycosylase
MNIFISDSNYVNCALALDDKRLVKMVLETAQLLSTAVNECGGSAPYKSTHKSHPCTIWARQTRGNFEWLLNHGFALALEYTERFKKTHKCMFVLAEIEEKEMSKHIPDGPLMPFPNCTANATKGISYKHISDVTEAYKQYLNARWATDTRKPVWTGRSKPIWANF